MKMPCQCLQKALKILHSSLQGPVGIDGANGTHGEVGMTGQQGEKGAKGERGIVGNRGSPGINVRRCIIVYLVKDGL